MNTVDTFCCCECAYSGVGEHVLDAWMVFLFQTSLLHYLDVYNDFH